MNNNMLSSGQGLALVMANIFAGLAVFLNAGGDFGHNLWQSLVITIPFAFVMLFFLTLLFKRLDGQSIFYYLDDQSPLPLYLWMGWWLILLFIYCSSFIAAAFDMWQYLDSNTSFFWLKLILLFVFLIAASYWGLQAIARAFLFILLFFMLFFLIDSLLLLGDMNVTRILPINMASTAQWLPAAGKIIGSMLVLLPLSLFYLDKIDTKSNSVSLLLKGFLLCGAYYLVVTIRNIFLFGDLLIETEYPLLSALRLIVWGGVEYLVLPAALLLLAVTLGGISLLWCMAVDFIFSLRQKTVKKGKKRFIICIFWAILQLLAVLAIYALPKNCIDSLATYWTIIAFAGQMLCLIFLLWQVNRKEFCKNY